MSPTFRQGQRIFFIALLAVVTLFFLWMIQDFIFPVFWAIVFALLLHPAYLRIYRHIKNQTVSALLVMFGALLLVVIPIVLLGATVAQEGYALYKALTENNMLSSLALPAPIMDTLARFGVNVAEIQANVASWAQSASSWIVAEAIAVSSATFSAILKTLIMLYLLFFFLRDGEKLGEYVMHRVPLGDRKERALFNRFASTTRAMMKGTILTAIAQGIAGGLMFWIAGIENAVLWGAVMGFLSIIPAAGPAVVWIPAGIILFLSGAIVPALIVLIGGAVIVGSLDNILRPMLVGYDTKMPDALIMVAIIGGIAVFGLTGVIVGPVIAALALAVWDMFAEEFEKELTAQG